MLRCPLCGAARARVFTLSGLAARRHFALQLVWNADNLALENPSFDTDFPVSGVRLGEAVVHIGSEGVKRHASFNAGLGASNLISIKSPAHHDFHAQRAFLHRNLNVPAHYLFKTGTAF